MEYTRRSFLMQQAYATLFSLANKLQVKGDQMLKYFTSRQLMVMIAIGHLPEGEASLNQIARMLGTTKQTAKQLVSLIEEHGYVVSEPSQLDRRAVNIRITEEGKAALLEDGMHGMEYFSTLFHDFSTEELETLWNLLKKLYCFDGEQQAGFEDEFQVDIT